MNEKELSSTSNIEVSMCLFYFVDTVFVICYSVTLEKCKKPISVRNLKLICIWLICKVKK